MQKKLMYPRYWSFPADKASISRDRLLPLLLVAHQKVMLRPWDRRHLTYATRHEEIYLVLTRKLPPCSLTLTVPGR